MDCALSYFLGDERMVVGSVVGDNPTVKESCMDGDVVVSSERGTPKTKAMI